MAAIGSQHGRYFSFKQNLLEKVSLKPNVLRCLKNYLANFYKNLSWKNFSIAENLVFIRKFPHDKFFQNLRNNSFSQSKTFCEIKGVTNIFLEFIWFKGKISAML